MIIYSFNKILLYFVVFSVFWTFLSLLAFFACDFFACQWEPHKNIDAAKKCLAVCFNAAVFRQKALRCNNEEGKFQRFPFWTTFWRNFLVLFHRCHFPPNGQVFKCLNFLDVISWKGSTDSTIFYEFFNLIIHRCHFLLGVLTFST